MLEVQVVRIAVRLVMVLFDPLHGRLVVLPHREQRRWIVPVGFAVALDVTERIRWNKWISGLETDP